MVTTRTNPPPVPPVPPAPAAARAIEADCPRCGYNQRGTIETWTTACPLDGTCSECGLVFAWSDLLAQGARLPNWSVETGGPFAIIRTLPATMRRTLHPRRFWSEISLAAPCRWGRLVLFNLLLVAMLIVGLHCTIGALAAAEWRTSILASTNPANLNELIAAVTKAMLQPWSETPLGWWRASGWRRNFPMSSPADLVSLLWRDSHLRPLLIQFAVMHLVMPLVFIVLPYARRRAKVRAVHIVRITLYTTPLFLWMLLGLLTMSIADTAYVATSGSWLDMLFNWYASADWMLPLLTVVLLTWWWRCACRHYLKMTHSFAIAVSVVVIAGLAGLVMLYFTQGDMFMTRLFEYLLFGWYRWA